MQTCHLWHRWLRSPSPGLSEPPDSFAGTGVCLDPGSIHGFAFSSLDSVPRGAPCALQLPGLWPRVPVHGDSSRAGHGGAKGRIPAGTGGCAAMGSPAVAGGVAGSQEAVLMLSLVFQAVISAGCDPSAPAPGRIGFPTSTATAAHVLSPVLLRPSWMRERHPSPGVFWEGSRWDTFLESSPWHRAGPAQLERGTTSTALTRAWGEGAPCEEGSQF